MISDLQAKIWTQALLNMKLNSYLPNCDVWQLTCRWIKLILDHLYTEAVSSSHVWGIDVFCIVMMDLSKELYNLFENWLILGLFNDVLSTVYII
jgi:hypothetical protein